MMKRIFATLLITTATIITGINGYAQSNEEHPTIDPTATYTDADSNVPQETIEMSGSAPVIGVFRANPKNAAGWDANYEWRFTMENNDAPYLVRYEEDTEVTFNTAGSHRIVCYATFTRDNEVIKYGADYWAEDKQPFLCTVSESKLEMPNAFSPNGDGINDIYKAKDSYRSLVEFHAYIYNRYGQLLFDWTNPADGWDGTYKGKDVKDGVYYVLVKAKGADGRTYDIKRDVNLLRGYTEGNTLND